MTNTAGSGKGAPVCVVMMMMMNVHTALHVYSVEDSWIVEAVNAIPSPHPIISDITLSTMKVSLWKKITSNNTV